MAPSSFGMLLKGFRTDRSMTQEELAERARMSTRGLQNLEHGLSRRPRRHTLDLLAQALQLSSSDWARFLIAARTWSDPPAPDSIGVHPTMFIDGVLPTLVGREHEMALVSRFLAGERQVAAAPRILLPAGEPGIGKTRLLQAVAEQAEGAGRRILIGGCWRRDGQDPYAPLTDALALHIRTLPPYERQTALEGCAWLGRLLPELGGPADSHVSADQERRLMYDAVGRYLANVAGPAGTLLILDDVQWAGPDALDLVHYLARNAALPLRIVAAYRDSEVQPSDPLNLLSADLAQAGLALPLPLGPLAAADTATLLAELLVGASRETHAMTERALRRSGGVPFFLVSYAQAMAAGAADGVPWDLAQGIRRRVSVLSEPARKLLEVAAIIGRQAPRRLLMAAAGQSEEDVAAGLEAACRARLLVEDGEADYVFVHDVIHEVLEADVGAARRELLHRRVAYALVADPSGVSAEVSAYHFSRGGEPEKAAHYLEEAGDRAWGRRASRSAETLYRQALEVLDRLGRAADAGRVREKLGEALNAFGRYDDALTILGQAAATYRAASDLDGLARVSVGIAQAHALRGTSNEGIESLQSLLEQLKWSGASLHIPALYTKLALLLFSSGRYYDALGVGARAADLAQAADNDAVLLEAAWNTANILQMLGQLNDAFSAFQSVTYLAESADDWNCLTAVHRNLAYLHGLRGSFSVAMHHLERSQAMREPLENPANFAFTLAMRGWFAALYSDFQDAHAMLDRASALSRELDRSVYSAYPPIFQARLALVEGDRLSALDFIREALALCGQNEDLQARRWAAATLAEIEILEGHPAAARDCLVPLLDRPSVEECDVTVFLPVLAWAQLELGQVDEASATVDQALTRARPEEMRLVLVDALRVRAMIALRREQWDAAARSLEEGLVLARSMPYPSAGARLRALQEQLPAPGGHPGAQHPR